MKWIRYNFYILIVHMVLNSCGTNYTCSCYDNKVIVDQVVGDSSAWKDSSIDMETVKNQIGQYGYDPIFGLHLITTNQEFFFIFLDRQQIVRAINLGNPKDTFSAKMNFNTTLSKAYSVLVRNDTIHLVDNWRKKYFRYYLDNHKNINFYDSLDLSNYLTTNLFFVTKPNYKTIEYCYPFVFIPYGKRKQKNLIDNYAYLKINILSKTIEKILNYPECYHCSYIYDKQSTISITDEGDLVGVFNKSEEVIRITLSDSLIYKNHIYHSCNFSDFDKNKVQNLSYVRKYLENSEKNTSIFNVANKKLAVLKREQKNSVNDNSSYSLFLLENNLKQLSEHKIKYKIFAPASFEYRKGLLIFSDSLNKAYYYEVQH